MVKNSFGQESKLYLKTKRSGDKTVIADLSFTAPFKIMRPFYLKDDLMTVMLLMASAGIMAGDRQSIKIVLEKGSRLEFVSQAYEKIHRMENGFAERRTEIEIGKDAFLLYNPLPMIPYESSDFRNKIRVSLHDHSSQFIMSEILTCGRYNHGEFFKYDRYENHITIFEDGKLTYRDNSCFIPKLMPINGFGFYEGYTHFGTLILCNTKRNEDWIERARSIIEKAGLEGGVTRNECGYLIVRILAKSAETLIEIFEKLIELE